MRKILRFVLVGVLVGTGTLASAAISRADVNGANGTNVQNGQNSSTSSQSGKGKTGSAVGGQVSGVVSGGRASVDARNTSKDSSVTSGEVRGSNSASSYVGLNDTEGTTTVASDVTTSCNSGGCDNIQDGNNRYNLTQTLAAVSGDGVGGQVIGLVGASPAEPSIVASNNSDGVDVATGDARGTNDSSAFVGLNSSDGGPAITADLSGVCVCDAGVARDPWRPACADGAGRRAGLGGRRVELWAGNCVTANGALRRRTFFPRFLCVP